MHKTKRVRIVTAASLFDGHDAAINIMRRIMQSKGAEIIHLGHNRSVKEIVECAIEEDADAIAITSYQGGHVEFFKYMKDLLEESEFGHIKIFGGGGGTILPTEIDELHAYGITKIYSPDDGRQMGLEGMIEEVIKNSVANSDTGKTDNESLWGNILPLHEMKDIRLIARAITLAEDNKDYSTIINQLIICEESSTNKFFEEKAAVLGITGTGGAGKSSVTDELVRRFLHYFPDKTIAVISIDPSKKKTGGALLGDRIRMNAISHPRAYMRSMATREDNAAVSNHSKEALEICKAAGFDLIIFETAGVGQSDTAIIDYVDISMYIMTPEYGAASQLEKINMLDYADVICINKFDKSGALDAYNDVCKQYKRNHNLWTTDNKDIPVVSTIAAQFNDDGVNRLFDVLIQKLQTKTGVHFGAYTSAVTNETEKPKTLIIPAKRVRYLSEISETIRSYNNNVNQQSDIASRMYQINGAIKALKNE